MRLSVMSPAAVLAAVAMVLLGSCSSSGVAPPAAFEDCTDQTLQTLAVKVRTDKDSYRPGDVARFRVLVMRAAQTDEVGDGISQDVGPVEGAEVALGVTVKGVSLAGGGISDEDGRTTIRMSIARRVPTGSADVLASATAETVDVHCVPKEAGHVEKPDLFRIVR